MFESVEHDVWVILSLRGFVFPWSLLPIKPRDPAENQNRIRKGVSLLDPERNRDTWRNYTPISLKAEPRVSENQE